MAKKHIVLVTGVAGFIGSNLALRLLAAGHDVIGVDNLAYGRKEQIPSGVDFREVDIRSEELLKTFHDVDTVFHLAAKNDLLACQENPAETIDINVRGTANVFEAARRAGVKKVIFASSSALEEGEARLKGFYAISKSSCEKIAEGYRAAFGLTYVLPRYFNVYGPRQNYSRKPFPPVMSEFILRAMRGQSPTLYEGYERDGRDFIFVDDINDFHLQCLDDERVDNGLFRLGTGESTSIEQIWKTVGKLTGSTLAPTVKPGPRGHVPVITLADTKNAEQVGWKAKTSLVDGLRMQYEYLKEEFAKGNIT